MVAIPTGLLGSEEALRNALRGSTQILEPFAAGGVGAADLQAGQSGALGPEAQARAFRDFRSSPGQQFLRDEGEQAILRNASAIGGLGGGRVREALQERGIGLAAQDFGNQFGRLGQVAGRGTDIAGALSGLTSRTGQDIAGGRTQAGRDIAQSIGGTTSALANLVNQQGQGLSGVIGTGAGNLSNILAGAGTGQLQSQTQLAELLANLAAGQGSQLSSLQGIPGIQTQEPSEAPLTNISNIGSTLIELLRGFT